MRQYDTLLMIEETSRLQNFRLKNFKHKDKKLMSDIILVVLKGIMVKHG